MNPDLHTTNWLLGVMAVGSAIQTLMLIGVAVVGYRLYRQLSTTVAELETRHVEPLRRQVDGILTDVQAIATRVSQQTERVDHAITGAIDQVDETTDRIKDTLREKMSKATGVVRGVRAVIAALLTTEPSSKPPVEAGGGL